MKNKQEILEDLLVKVPKEVGDDVRKRVSDWVGSGGKMNDPYIDQQIRFLNNWIEKLNVVTEDVQNIYGFRGNR